MKPRLTQAPHAATKMMVPPQAKKALNALQMPLPQLAELVAQELENNPLLEMGEEWYPAEEESTQFGERLSFSDQDYTIFAHLDDEIIRHFADSDAPCFEPKEFTLDQIPLHHSRFDHLMMQAHDAFEDPADVACAEQIIGNLDDDGFLTTPVSELTGDRAQLQRVLSEIQGFTPAGIAASNLQHSLMLQLQRKWQKGTIAWEIVQDHFDQLMKRNVKTIAKEMKLTEKEIYAAIDNYISPLNFHPGSENGAAVEGEFTADVTLVEENDKLLAFVNKEPLHGLRLNWNYLKLLNQPDIDETTRQFIEKKTAGAKWLLRTVTQRNTTLQRVAQFLAYVQKEYLSDPNGTLNPLTMAKVADALGIAESTVARAVKDKMIAAPRGFVPMRSLFSIKYGKTSQDTVLHLIRDLIRSEDRAHPLTDEQIVQMLADRGISCARRTVGKHRNNLGIARASQRRRK